MALSAFTFSWFLRPRKPTPVKNSTYECGILPQGSAWIQYNVVYYLFALIFVIFDVEVVFLFPWAITFKTLGPFAYVEMLIFIFILLLGLAYSWKKGILKWQ
ncbi:MAG: NADH-quinone oxidoreductase subunit A [Candidatus Omnitrophica bacterium]|nr:NADH-quinone oxidoreductase subunit A [Candidatus Omnitrophota bacterium]